MGKLDNYLVPEEIGTIKGRYIWDKSRHSVKNHFLAVALLLLFTIISAHYNFHFEYRVIPPLAQIVLTMSLSLGVFYVMKALDDYRCRHLKVSAIVGEEGFCIVQYNDLDDEIISEYVQVYRRLDRIEKYVHNDISEEGIYLRTVSTYAFYAPDLKYFIKLKYNRRDVRLVEQEGLADVRAILAIEDAYKQCRMKKIAVIPEPDYLIPSRPRPLLKINQAIMWSGTRNKLSAS